MLAYSLYIEKKIIKISSSLHLQVKFSFMIRFIQLRSSKDTKKIDMIYFNIKILKQFIEMFSKESGSHSETLKLRYVICLVLKKAHRIKRHKKLAKSLWVQKLAKISRYLET